jgi:hypothetical protein
MDNVNETSVTETNAQFNRELHDFILGKLPKNHVFKLGVPGEILRQTGFPPEQPIELSARQLAVKQHKHPFLPGDLKNLVSALHKPIAVFEYGDKEKAQNVIVELEKDDKKFLAGIHFNQKRHGTIVSDIRTVFNKDSADWLNWINQGKMLYGNTKKLQALIAQQRNNLAEVGYLNLKSIENILQNAGTVNYFQAKFEKNSPKTPPRRRSSPDAGLER